MSHTHEQNSPEDRPWPPAPPSAPTEEDAPPAPRHYGRDLTTGSIPLHVLMFSLPMLGGSVLQTAYSIVNAIWVGRYLGKAEMAAVTASFPVFFLFMAVAGGLTLATNILIAQYVGARNWPHVRRVVQNSTLLVALACVVLTGLGELSIVPLLRLMGTPPDVLPLATGYMRIFLLAMPGNFGIFLVAAMLRGIGDSKTPLYFQIVFLLLTAILDPVLMFGKLGIPDGPHLNMGFAGLGLNGTAWATLITMSGAVVAVYLYMTATRNPVTPRLKGLALDMETTRLTVLVGVPSMLQQAISAFNMFFIVGIVNFFGENATAAFGAALRIDQVSFMPAMAIGMAVSTLTGQNLGAGRMDRVRQTFTWGMLFSCAITTVVALVVFLAPQALILPFTRDPQVLALGTQYLRIMWISYVLFAIMFVSNGVINGSGQTVVTTVITFIAMLGIRWPLAYLLARVVFHDVTFVWISMVISVGVGMVLSLGYYFSGRWQQDVIDATADGVPGDGSTGEWENGRTGDAGLE